MAGEITKLTVDDFPLSTWSKYEQDVVSAKKMIADNNNNKTLKYRYIKKKRTQNMGLLKMAGEFVLISGIVAVPAIALVGVPRMTALWAQKVDTNERNEKLIKILGDYETTSSLFQMENSYEKWAREQIATKNDD